MANNKRKESLGSKIIRGIMYVAGIWPLKFQMYVAKVIAFILKSVLHYRQDVVYTNLSRSFPDKSYRWIKETANAYYLHMAEMIMEAIWFSACRGPRRLRKEVPVEIENPELLAEIYEKAPSVMILDTHCGNWELLGGLPFYGDESNPLKAERLRVIYKKLSSRVWDDVFYENRRCAAGKIDGQIEASGMLRYMVGHKKEKFIYMVNNDQYPKESFCEIGNFMNQPTTAFIGASTIAHKFAMAVFHMSMINDRSGHYILRFNLICEDASAMKPEEITRKYYDFIEQDIKANPHNWLWSHKRWKNIK